MIDHDHEGVDDWIDRVEEKPTVVPLIRPDPLNWVGDFELNSSEVEEISVPNWVYEGLFTHGHVIAIVAPPNGGKTTICFYLGGLLAKKYQIVYIHADTGPSEAKLMLAEAQAKGFRYLTPDLKVGLSMSDVVKQLQTLAAGDADLSEQVWFFDTLKKMGNVIHKSQLKAILQIMRKLSGRGMTCVLLCHTNKYKDDEGNHKYEGTGDLESDVDELIYFDPDERPDKSLIVSTRCSKRRADIEDMTWTITPDRRVIREQTYVDIAAKHAADEQQEKDSPVIEVITDALIAGHSKQTEIFKFCKAESFGEKRVRAVLKRYSGKLWNAEKQFQKNAWRYTLR